MIDAKNVLTIGIEYRIVRGGVAAVENVYSTFFHPFNHVATTVEKGAVRKAFICVKAIIVFLGWMLFHKEIKIVHVHGACDTSFWRKRIFICIAKAFNKKVVYHMHGGRFAEFTQEHDKAVRSLVKKCDCIIALSDYWKNYFEKELGCNNVVIIKNVITAPILRPHSSGRFSLLFLGLLGHNKGIYDLLDCITEHRDEFKNKLRLYVGGNGEVEKVKQIIASNDLSDIVSFEGWVAGNKKIELLNKTNAFILPSYSEGLPISILEAMSYSLPIISTNVGGIPEILKDGENGYLIEPGDKESMYKSIISLMNDSDLCNKMGECSKAKVSEHLPDYVENQLKDLYASIL